jgi:hypothetical protein
MNAWGIILVILGGVLFWYATKQKIPNPLGGTVTSVTTGVKSLITGKGSLGETGPYYNPKTGKLQSTNPLAGSNASPLG